MLILSLSTILTYFIVTVVFNVLFIDGFIYYYTTSKDQQSQTISLTLALHGVSYELKLANNTTTHLLPNHVTWENIDVDDPET